MKKAFKKISSAIAVWMITLVVFISWASTSQAQETATTSVANYWTGHVSNEWMNAANWNKKSIPVATDSVIIPSGCMRYPVLNAGVSGEAGYFEIEENARLTITSGMLSVSGNMLIQGELIQGNGTVRLNGTELQQVFTNKNVVFNTLVLTNTSADGIVFHNKLNLSDRILVTEGTAYQMTTDEPNDVSISKSMVVELIAE